MEPEYPLDPRRGVFQLPRDVAWFEPLMRDGVLMRAWVLLNALTSADGWARGPHGNKRLAQDQALCSIRTMASALGVGKNTAERALAELERLGLITREAGQCGTVVTLRTPEPSHTRRAPSAPGWVHDG